MQFKRTRLSEALGRIWGGEPMEAPIEKTFGVDNSRFWLMSDIVDSGVKLDQFDEKDWFYSAHFDIVFVRLGSPLYTWLSLH